MYYYIHYPFCRVKCPYCRFPTIGGHPSVLAPRYLKVLKEEICDYVRSNSHTTESLYFGGGTPSLLTPYEIGEIISLFGASFGEKSPEITLEATPESITPDLLTILNNLGINRVSVGIETFCDESLHACNRLPSTTPLQALRVLQESEFENISCDFIFGLPFSNPDTTMQDIQKALEVCPKITHLSVYLLEDYETPGEGKYEKILYPEDFRHHALEQQAYQDAYLQVLTYLQTHGFEHYEQSNFARKGYACTHNQAYWNHSEVKGFGLGASSYQNGTRYANQEDFLGYFQGKKAYIETLNQEQVRIEKILFGCRTSGVPPSLLTPKALSHAQTLQTEKLLSCQNGLLKPTNPGHLVLDSIISLLIE